MNDHADENDAIELVLDNRDAFPPICATCPDERHHDAGERPHRKDGWH
jgi:hypothetical protein